MKSLKTIILKNVVHRINEENMTDSEISFYPDKVKYDGMGAVTSYNVKVTLDEKPLKNEKLKKQFISWLSDAEIKSLLSITPKAMLYSTEVYEAKGKKYIYFDNKKVFI